MAREVDWRDVERTCLQRISAGQQALEVSDVGGDLHRGAIAFARAVLALADDAPPTDQTIQPDGYGFVGGLDDPT